MSKIIILKTKIFISVVLITLTIQTNAQTIPNPGFENWSWFGGWYENPDNWVTNNTQIFTPVVKDSIYYQGNYAVKVYSNGYCKSKFEFPNHPKSLKVYIKTEFIEIDTVSIDIFIYLDGNIVDNGSWMNTNIAQIANWTMMSIPITQNSASVDSIEIQINGGIQWGSSLSVDNLLFEISSGIKGKENSVFWTLSPNPLTDHSILTFENSKDENQTLTIYSMTGQLLLTIDNIMTSQVLIESKNLASGLYLFQLQNNRNIVATGKLIVE